MRLEALPTEFEVCLNDDFSIQKKYDREKCRYIVSTTLAGEAIDFGDNEPAEYTYTFEIEIVYDEFDGDYVTLSPEVIEKVKDYVEANHCEDLNFETI